MDRISEASMQAVLARLEMAKVKPPADLDGPALAMFTEIVASNKSRPWNAGHAHALADYCRVTTMWDEQFRALAREGPVVERKPNARLKVLNMLSTERQRLAVLLGMQTASRDRLAGGTSMKQTRTREMGAAMAESAAAPGGDLLA